MKTHRYRKDLTSYHFEIRHKFVKGFNRLYQQGRVKFFEMNTIPDGMGFPEWHRPVPNEFIYAGLSDRKADILVLTNNYFRKICDYIYTPKVIVVRVLFEFSALVIFDIDGEIIHHRFPYRTNQCLGIERKLFKHSLKSDSK